MYIGCCVVIYVGVSVSVVFYFLVGVPRCVRPSKRLNV